MQSTGRENEVLLDENLVESEWVSRNHELCYLCNLAAHLSPFYLREHSKRILRGALYNDSKFLADINVMDYSLVVGVDSLNNELVVGIVGECRDTKLMYCVFIPHRLHPNVHMGQKARELGQGFNIFGRCEQGRANHHRSSSVSATLPQCNGKIFPASMFLFVPQSCSSLTAVQVPDRWMKQRDAPEEEGNNLLELWPDW